MKRCFPLLLILALLTACGAPSAVESEILPEEPPEETASLPELTPPGKLSAPAIILEGRLPEKDYELPEKIEGVPFFEGVHPVKLAELPEADAEFYAVGDETILLRWGDSLAEFDWIYTTPRNILPRLYCFDADGDRKDELAIVCYIGSGTETSVEELHIVEKDPDGALTAYTLPESLWLEQVPTLFDAVMIDGRTFAILGRELVEIDNDGLDLETACTGLIAGFDCSGGLITFQGMFALCHAGSAHPCYVADTSADVLYKDGVFTLRDFHLYGDNQ